MHCQSMAHYLQIWVFASVAVHNLPDIGQWLGCVSEVAIVAGNGMMVCIGQ